MKGRKPLAITLSDTTAYLGGELNRRFNVFPLHQLDGIERDRWLSTNGAAVTIVVTSGNVGCHRLLLDALPNAKIIAVHGVGYDSVDLAATRQRGIIVANTPSVLTDDVADLAVGLVICLLRGLVGADEFVRRGSWTRSEYPLKAKVTGKRFGIVGLGRIGHAIGERLQVFGPVSYTGTRVKQVTWTFLPDPMSLARSSDVLIVACSANEHTQSMIGEQILGALGENGYLVNVARGSIIDENALIRVLAKGKLAGAALDVFQHEPAVRQELLTCDRVVLTPHIGSATITTRKAMADALLANLDAFIAGRPIPHQVP